MAKITIITPVLNQANTIVACMESVAAQGDGIEHIIIDGGSTDGTVELIQKHSNRLAYWVSEPDRGQGDAINKGLTHATGTWCNWLNADDRLADETLATILNSVSDGTQVIVGRCQHIDKNGNTVAEGSARIWNSLEATLGNYSMGQPSVFYRTEVLRSLGGVNPGLHLCFDMDLWFRFLLMHGQDRIITTHRILSQFMVHPKAKSSRMASEMRAEKYGLYHALFRSVHLPPVIETFLMEYPIPNGVSYALPPGLNEQEMLAHFAWHLMLDAYAGRDPGKLARLFEVVEKGSRLSRTERWKWKLRTLFTKIQKT